MSSFASSLLDIPNGVERWHFVAYDQLNQALLPEIQSESLGLIFIETSWKANQLPYHKQKLALQLSNQRHFALEMQSLGHPIRYVFSLKEYSEVLCELADEYGLITVTKPAELTLRKSISNLVTDGKIKILNHKGWLTTTEDFTSSVGDKPPWRMDKFYRHIRKSQSILLDENSALKRAFGISTVPFTLIVKNAQVPHLL